MRAADVMTTDVITVDPETTVQALATLLAERGISGAPVIDASGRLVGIISEGDLLHRAEIGTARRHRERRRSWWLDHFASDLARDYIKSHGRTVKDIMTRDVVTVTEDADLGDVAALLEAKRIKRVPVMREGKIVGIISRANIVRALGATRGAPPREGEGDDRSIRASLLAELGRERRVVQRTHATERLGDAGQLQQRNGGGVQRDRVLCGSSRRILRVIPAKARIQAGKRFIACSGPPLSRG